MAKMTVAKFRREAEKRREGRSRGAARYTPALKRFALEYSDKVIASGKPRAQAAKELGLCDVTLYGWQQAREAPPGKLERVKVSEEPPARTPTPAVATMTITTPTGITVTGLDVDTAAALLKALA